MIAFCDTVKSVNIVQRSTQQFIRHPASVVPSPLQVSAEARCVWLRVRFEDEALAP
jgi:hypothetical protein